MTLMIQLIVSFDKFYPDSTTVFIVEFYYKVVFTISCLV